MVPTEILAKQHYQSLKEVLEPCKLNVGLLTGSLKDRQATLDKLKDGKLDVLVGTHALFSEDVVYQNLGLVIADEQQRFGVLQRRKLLEKGQDVDFLLMSATPIPRTLASALYGDMDISIIKTLPAGRKSVITKLVKSNDLALIKNALLEVLSLKQQIYIVCPAIEDNDEFKALSTDAVFQMVQSIFSNQSCAVLHGRQKNEEKERIINDFLKGKTDILISTTVVEVGVNVPNATVMVVMDAERFGLSQLHQLRGRIKRSSKQGYCFLLTASKDERALKRLEVLVKSEDGFEIAKADLDLRGMGDMFGLRQSGLPNFILGNIFKDQKIMKAAKEDAMMILKERDKYASLITHNTKDSDLYFV